MQTYAKTKRQAGFKCETNDCSVKALAIACNVPYAVAHKALEKQGRKKRQGVYWGQIARGLASLGYEMTKVETKAKTIITLPRDKDLQDGFYVALTSGHIAAMVDGEIQDWSEGKRNRLLTVHKVTPNTTRRQRAAMHKELFA